MRLPTPPIPWFLRPLLAWQRRGLGHVLEPTAAWAWRPALTALAAMQNMSARINHALNARAHGFCSLPGAQDVRTEAEASCRR